MIGVSKLFAHSRVRASMHRHQLPLAFECSRSLSGMPARAGGRQRWCDGCARIVHDLSAHSEAEARALLRDASEQLCVAYRVDAGGQVQFGRRTLLDRVGAAVASAALLATAGCIGLPDREVASPEPEIDAQTWVELEPEPVAYAHRLSLGGLSSSVLVSDTAEIERRLRLEHKALEQMMTHAEQEAPR